MFSRRQLVSVFAAGLLTSLTPSHAAEATMVITCYSMSIVPATADFGGEQIRLSFTNEEADTINNEWFLSGGTSEVSSILVLELPNLPNLPARQMSAPASLRIPNSGDLDVNVLTDFFEVSKPVTTSQTTGEFSFDDGMDVYPGTLKATWARDAGATTGSCKLQVSVPDLGLVNVTFNHTFEILQFKGPITYGVTGTNVNATVDLQRLGGPGSFSGPWPLYQFDRVELGWREAPWNGPSGQKFKVLESFAIEDTPLTLARAGLQKSDFFLGAFFFDDGDPTTPFPDEYDLWEILIVDTNDADGDNIPDLSDEPGSVVTPEQPILKVRVEGGRLKLQIQGKTGQTVALEQRTNLETGAWAPGQSMTLTADSQEFDLGVPAASVFFIRAKL